MTGPLLALPPELPASAPGPRPRALWISIAVVAVLIVGGAIVGVVLGARQLGETIAKASAPHTYVSPDGYRVVFPGKPKAVGSNPALHQVEVVHGSTTYLVESETLPTMTSDTNVDLVLTGALNGGAKSMGGRASTPKKVITLDGKPAESQTFDSSSGKLFVLASLHDGDRFVSIIAINPSTAQLHRLISSFTFTR